jgi:translocation and assembly module TamA
LLTSRFKRVFGNPALAALMLACLVPAPALSQTRAAPAVVVTWEAPEPLRSQLEKLLPPPRAPEEGERRSASIRPWVRDVRRRVPEIAAAEGYFSAKVDIDWEPGLEKATVTVVPGARTVVSKVDIEFTGDLAGEGEEREARRREAREAWALKEGMPFRSADWEEAKRGLREKLVEADYAAGDIAESEAEVNADTASASLKLKVDSGPRFTLGIAEVQGLVHYPDSVVKRVYDIKPGERYRQERLIALQRALQNGPWFSSVTVEIDRDPGFAVQTPVKITVIERPRHEVGLAVGFGTDEGIRGEVGYRYRNLFDRGFDLQSALRADRQRQFGYADVYLPQGIFGNWIPEWIARRIDAVPAKDSFGVLAEHTNIQGLETRRFAVAGYRQYTGDQFDTRVGLSYQIENAKPEGADEQLKRALAPVIAFTWRHVDDLFDPKRGGVLTLNLAGGAKAIASTQDFLKTYAQYTRWFPVTKNDQLILRGEIGRTYAFTRDGIPEDFLFRAGGTRSVRGYEYQSLGVKEGNATVGGRYLATASADFVHWLNEKWGGAVFFDIGDAADSTSAWTPNKSYGLGARYKTPAGPLALDFAYADRDRKVRLSFSVTVAF